MEEKGVSQWISSGVRSAENGLKENGNGAYQDESSCRYTDMCLNVALLLSLSPALKETARRWSSFWNLCKGLHWGMLAEILSSKSYFRTHFHCFEHHMHATSLAQCPPLGEGFLRTPKTGFPRHLLAATAGLASAARQCRTAVRWTRPASQWQPLICDASLGKPVSEWILINLSLLRVRLLVSVIVIKQR